jgi:hypothetical protein
MGAGGIWRNIVSDFKPGSIPGGLSFERTEQPVGAWESPVFFVKKGSGEAKCSWLLVMLRKEGAKSGEYLHF